MHNYNYTNTMHHGRINILRGYVSKSSVALNPLTITQLACERYAWRGPAHQLAVRMHIIITMHPSNRPCAGNLAESLHFSAFHYTCTYLHATVKSVCFCFLAFLIYTIIIATIIIAVIKRTTITADTAIPAMMLPLRLESVEDEGI